MTNANYLKRELKLREDSLGRWGKYLKGNVSMNPSQKRLAEKYMSRLENEIHGLREELKEEEGGISWTRELLEEPSRLVEIVIGEAKGILSNLFPKKLRKSYFCLLVFFFSFLVLKNSSIIGYTVLETVTNTTVASYFVAFVLFISIIAFYKLD